MIHTHFVHCLTVLLIISTPITVAQSHQKKHDIFNLSLAQLLEIQVVTAASGYEQKVKDAPATVVVVLRKQWEAMGFNSLYDVLNTITGVYIGMDTVGFERENISIRGLSGPGGGQVKLLMDGSPLEDRLQGGQKKYGDFKLTGIKRIEIIKGPGSVVYGADAFAGVVNIVSEDVGDSANNHASAQRGSFGLSEAEFSFGEASGELKWHASANWSQRDNTDRVIDMDAQTLWDATSFSQISAPASNAPGPLQDWYEHQNLLIKGEYKGLSFQTYIFQNTTGSKLGAADRLDDPNNPYSFVEIDYRLYKLSYPLDALSESIPGIMKLEYSYEDSDDNFDFIAFPQDTVLLIGEDGNLFTDNAHPFIVVGDGVSALSKQIAKVNTIKLNHVFTAFEKHGVRWELGQESIDYRTQQARMLGPGITDAVSMPRPTDGSALPLGLESRVDTTNDSSNQFIPAMIDRNYWFVSLQDEWKPISEVTVSLGIRYDDYSDFGSTTNPRLGLNWQVSNTLRLNSFYGSAFRAPSFNDLFSKNNPSLIGDPTLKPETIDNFEIGYSYSPGQSQNFIFSGSFFKFKTDNNIRNKFEMDINQFRSTNSEGDKGKGFEVDLRWNPVATLTANIGYSLVKIENRITNVEQANVPQQLLNASVGWKIAQDIQLSVNLRSVAGRVRDPTDARAEPENYTTVSTSIVWNNLLQDGLSLRLSGRNITDEETSQTVANTFLENDIPMTGEQFSVSVKFMF